MMPKSQQDSKYRTKARVEFLRAVESFKARMLATVLVTVVLIVAVLSLAGVLWINLWRYLL